MKSGLLQFLSRSDNQYQRMMNNLLTALVHTSADVRKVAMRIFTYFPISLPEDIREKLINTAISALKHRGAEVRPNAIKLLAKHLAYLPANQQEIILVTLVNKLIHYGEMRVKTAKAFNASLPVIVKLSRLQQENVINSLINLFNADSFGAADASVAILSKLSCDPNLRATIKNCLLQLVLPIGSLSEAKKYYAYEGLFALTAYMNTTEKCHLLYGVMGEQLLALTIEDHPFYICRLASIAGKLYNEIGQDNTLLLRQLPTELAQHVQSFAKK